MPTGAAARRPGAASAFALIELGRPADLRSGGVNVGPSLAAIDTRMTAPPAPRPPPGFAQNQITAASGCRGDQGPELSRRNARGQTSARGRDRDQAQAAEVTYQAALAVTPRALVPAGPPLMGTSWAQRSSALPAGLARSPSSTPLNLEIVERTDGLYSLRAVDNGAMERLGSAVGADRLIAGYIRPGPDGVWPSTFLTAEDDGACSWCEDRARTARA
jgi:hypothetical protein